MEKEDMFDFLQWQDRFYRAPTGGEFNTTHIFSFEGMKYGKKPTTMMKQDYFGAEIRIDKLLPTTRNKKCEVLEPAQRKYELQTC